MMGLVDKAVMLAVKAHKGQVRKYTGKPYISHPLAVGVTLSNAGASDVVVAAGILHDVIEDTFYTFEDIAKGIGNGVASLVLEVTDPYPSGSGGNRSYRKAKYAEKLARGSAEAQTIKLADLLDNTKDIVERDPGFAKVYLREAQDMMRGLRKGDPALYTRLDAQIIELYGKVDSP